VGKRWTGAILYVLLHEERPLRFSQIGHAVPDLSDRLLSERMKELERCGIVERRVTGTSPVRVEYALTDRGRDLAPALAELKDWADRWLN
jgi:DNA-binding HxlR family transcriptional regulator